MNQKLHEILIKVPQLLVMLGKFCMCIPIFVIIFSIQAMSQNGTPGELKDAKAFYSMAYDSMAFFLYSMAHNQAFVENLTADEKKMLEKTFGIASEVAFLNWAKKNSIQIFPMNVPGKPKYVIAYALPDDRVVQRTTDYSTAPALVFKADQDLFDINEKNEIRSAGTDTEFDRPIFVNLKRIHEPDAPAKDFASAFPIMFHEFGHKLGDEKIQAVIESLAGKLELAIQGMTKSTKVGNTIVHRIHFENFPNYDRYIENAFYGEYHGVNIPKTLHPFSVFDNQGIYVWTESGGVITDISASVRAKLRQHAPVKYVNDSYYTFTEHVVILAKDLSVIPARSGNDFTISVNSNVLRVVVPFMKTGSYNPKQYQLSERAFPYMPPHSGDFAHHHFQYHMSQDKPKMTGSSQRALEFRQPGLQGEIVAQSLMGQDYILKVKIPEDLKFYRGEVPNSNWIYESEVWPEIGVKIGGVMIYFKAQKQVGENSVYTFVIPKFDELKRKEVIVEELRFRMKVEELTEKNADAITKGFLDRRVVLSRGEDDQTGQKAPKLKSVSIFDGKAWVPMRQKLTPKGSRIRFVIQSDAELSQMTVTVEYGIEYLKYSEMGTFRLPTEGLQIGRATRRLTFDRTQFSQRLQNGKLIVELDIDRGAVLSRNFVQDLNLVDLPFAIKDTVPKISETFSNHVMPERNLIEVEFFTTSGDHSGVVLRSPLTIKKTGAGLSCLDLF